ncbi:MAG: CcoQ/FixQ family Cbb3-type cytochrome c oxidase assembly chaperone [Chitinophagales bacterium]
MFQNNLASITGIAIYPLISFVAFFLFFAAVSVYAFMQDKQEIKKISEMPLHDDVITDQQNHNA